MSTYNEILDRAQSLTPDEQKRLLEDLASLVRQQVTTEGEKSSQQLPRKNLGKWRGFLPKRVDALEFQLQLRTQQCRVSTGFCGKKAIAQTTINHQPSLIFN